VRDTLTRSRRGNCALVSADAWQAWCFGSYGSFIPFCDVTTRRLMEEILAEEEEHADDLLDLMDG
jgi:hypothetical protein